MKNMVVYKKEDGKVIGVYRGATIRSRRTLARYTKGVDPRTVGFFYIDEDTPEGEYRDRIKIAPAEMAKFYEYTRPFVRESRFTSVIILTMNGLGLIRDCISSIQRNTKLPYEIIVVDQASTDGTLEYLGGIRGVRKKVIRNVSNTGFSKGNNQGIAVAEGWYIVLINNDTIVGKGWLSVLLLRLQDHDVGVVGVSGGILDREFRHRGCAFSPGKEVDYIEGWCLATKTNVIQKIGVLDERFTPIYSEDVDFCLRVRRAGWKVVCAERPVVRHLQGGTVKATKKLDGISLTRVNRLKLIEKWGSEYKKESYDISPKRILCIRRGAVGDVIRTIPAVRGLRENNPDAHIHYYASHRCCEAIERSPYIDWVIRDHDEEAIRKSREYTYDLIVNFGDFPADAVLVGKWDHKEVYGHHCGRNGKMVYDPNGVYMWYSDEIRKKKEKAGEHYTKICCDIARVSSADLRPEIGIGVADRERAKEIWREYGLEGQEKVIVFHFSSGWQTRTIPKEKCGRILRLLRGYGKVVF